MNETPPEGLPQPAWAPPEPPPLLAEKLGGWLFLPAIGLVLSPIIMLVTIGRNFLALSNDQAGIVEAHYSGYKASLIVENLVSVLLLAYVIYAAVMFFQRKSIVPKLMIILYAAYVVLAIGDLIMVALVFNDKIALVVSATLPPVVRSTIIAGIWIPYFIVSKRVQRTFVLP